MKPACGYTLLEIMIALAIVAIALGAAMRATLFTTGAAEHLRARTLAAWVAENRLAAHQALGSWPSAGTSHGVSDQAGITFAWREHVSATAEPALRRIEIAVMQPAQPDYTLAELTGTLARPVPEDAQRP